MPDRNDSPRLPGHDDGWNDYRRFVVDSLRRHGDTLEQLVRGLNNIPPRSEVRSQIEEAEKRVEDKFVTKTQFNEAMGEVRPMVKFFWYALFALLGIIVTATGNWIISGGLKDRMAPPIVAPPSQPPPITVPPDKR